MELYDVYSPANTIRAIKYRTKWTGHVALVVAEETYTQYFSGESRRKEVTWKT
jgi:hypothetical protein